MEPLLHYVLPLTALILLREKPRDAAFLALLGLAPDVDALFHIHRSISHSIPVISLIFIPLLAISWFGFKEKMRIIVVAYLTTLSHIILDLGASTPLFWPFYKPVIIRFAVYPPDFLEIIYPFFTQDGALITIILFVPIIYRSLFLRKLSQDSNI
jgi:membrane-bound metal-dependent hydrolase YbcI (DUF457 family)